ncbi:type II secretion system F family protein [Paenibacillus aurantiacus]|uniref:Type II secretion system F family protein n=1 Tax=Paenibacillus aurantiacus TaxID=1936118 RepID=A0ABV5KHY1_9BACL
MSGLIRRKSELAARLAWPGREEEASAGALPDYRKLELTRRQFYASASIGALIVFAAAYLFYHAAVLSIVLSAAGIVAPRFYRRSLMERRRLRLTLQFKEALYSLTASLAAGRSVENAFAAALDDLKLLYPNPDAEIRVEFDIIRTRLAYGEPMEEALLDFKQRADIEDISQFVDVFVICKRTGGDLVEVIRRTSQTIGEKLDVQQEIAVMVAQKKFESRIMMSIPFVFMAFLSFAAPDYMEPLYGGLGYVLLTAALMMLGGCYWLMSKLMNIQV